MGGSSQGELRRVGKTWFFQLLHPHSERRTQLGAGQLVAPSSGFFHINISPEEIQKNLKKAELPDICFPDLRHTAASLILNYGIPAIIISRRLGHAKPSITMDVYGHIIPSRQEEAANLMDKLMTA